MSHFPTNPHDTIQKLRHEIERLRKERDGLLAALEKISGYSMSQFNKAHDLASKCISVADEAIASVKSGE